jgi:hypothetical protein
MMAKSALQKKKDNPRSKYWQTKADDLWKLIIHDRGRCAVGNDDCSSKLEAHHLISRGNKSTRHCIENGILLCCNHHKFSVKLSAHKAPLAFSEWLEDNDPDTYEWCSKNKWKASKYDYEKAYGLLLEYCVEHGIDV